MHGTFLNKSQTKRVLNLITAKLKLSRKIQRFENDALPTAHLRTIGVGTSVGHGQISRASVLQLEVLILYPRNRKLVYQGCRMLIQSEDPFIASCAFETWPRPEQTVSGGEKHLSLIASVIRVERQQQILVMSQVLKVALRIFPK